MMGDCLRLGFAFDKRLCSATVQRLPAALEQALVGRVLDQRVLEAVGGGRRGAVDEQEVSFHELIQRGL
jgi:hypothetical protein